MAYAPDAVDLAAATVNEDAFTRTDEGTLIAQTSSRETITRMIRALDVTAGDRILEVGTGSGYSTALLAHLTGPDGHVTTLDVLPELTERASALLVEHGYPNTRALAQSGALGAPEYGPYDRIIAWTTPETVPKAWTNQAADTARLVTPLNIAGLSKTYAVITATITHRKLTADTAVARGAFVEMSDHVATQWLVPPHGIDALHLDSDGRPWWLSTFWLRDQPTPDLGTDLVTRLVKECTISHQLLDDSEAAEGFYGWLLATRPEGLTTACLGSPSWQIGHSDADSAAFIPLAASGPVSTMGNASSADELNIWAERWRAAGSPRWEDVRPETAQDETGDWVVRAGLAASRA